METTVNLEDRAFELSNLRARQTGRSLDEVISEAIVRAYAPEMQDLGQSGELPVDGEGGLAPGVNLDDHAALEDLLAGKQ